MGAMTEAIDRADPASDDPTETTPDDPRDVWISVALVVGLAIVHLWMALEVSTLPDAVFDSLDGIVGVRAANLVVTVLPAVPLALVVLFWARSRSLGVLAALVALESAQCWSTYVASCSCGWWSPATVDAADRMVSVTQWAVIVLLPTLAALAWGIARRRGRAWVPGLLVAGALAIPLRYVDARRLGRHRRHRGDDLRVCPPHRPHGARRADLLVARVATGARVRLDPIDPASAEPPFEQVRRQIAARVVSGELPAGTRLPTVRALADEVGLAVNTVARVYRELESDGVIVTSGRRGTFVSPTAAASQPDVQAAAAAYVDTVRRAGLGITEAQRLVQDHWAR